VADAVVVGRPSSRWGSEIVAVLAARPGSGAPPTDEQLRAHCRGSLAGYKVPKALVWVDRVVRSPAGKPDYAWARAVALEAAPGDTPGAQPENSSVV
jgi:3-oxocholest-4-en-26-oate---CoA ligase